jgi:hypothetical protein
VERRDEKMIPVPSGVHSGVPLRPSVVSCTVVPVEKSCFHNATLFPSGDKRGDRYMAGRSSSGSRSPVLVHRGEDGALEALPARERLYRTVLRCCRLSSGQCLNSMTRRKQRIPRIGLDFGRDVTITGIRENADGSLTLLGTDGEALCVPAGTTGLSYERRKGPKITVQIPDSGESIGSHPHALSQFTRTIGVDTNSLAIKQEQVCVTAVCELAGLRYDGPRWEARAEPLWALEFRQPTKDSERIGWRVTLEQGKQQGWLSTGSTVLLVVDTHLDNQHKINRRAAPLIDDFLLPPSVSIAYASSDAATDSPLNGLIARCDRLAEAVLEHVAQSAEISLGPLTAGARTPFLAHRWWKFAGESPGA